MSSTSEVLGTRSSVERNPLILSGAYCQTQVRHLKQGDVTVFDETIGSVIHTTEGIEVTIANSEEPPYIYPHPDTVILIENGD